MIIRDQPLAGRPPPPGGVAHPPGILCSLSSRLLTPCRHLYSGCPHPPKKRSLPRARETDRTMRDHDVVGSRGSDLHLNRARHGSDHHVHSPTIWPIRVQVHEDRSTVDPRSRYRNHAAIAHLQGTPHDESTRVNGDTLHRRRGWLQVIAWSRQNHRTGLRRRTEGTRQVHGQSGKRVNRVMCRQSRSPPGLLSRLTSRKSAAGEWPASSWMVKVA
jgi:hypothetical protein